jgi:peptide deformylase
MTDQLKIIHYPDPRLRKKAASISQFTPELAETAKKMIELMHADKGVGLAAPQVGLSISLFVMNPTGQPQDQRVYVNPQLSEGDGSELGEEGCLSLPGIRTNVDRYVKMTITAQDLAGHTFTESADGFVARIWQHEVDHLNGTLILDRMGPGTRLLFRKKIKDLEAAFSPTGAKVRR